jgi:hypothetical protein
LRKFGSGQTTTTAKAENEMPNKHSKLKTFPLTFIINPLASWKILFASGKYAH